MEVVESKRPSGEHMNFRKALLRNVAGGIGSVSYSNMSRDYSGTYSSQRQELVEMHGVLKQHWRRYIEGIEVRKWKNFVEACQMSGLVSIPNNATDRSVYYPNYTPPVMPWIDPAKEIKYFTGLIDSGLDSREYIAGIRGRDWKGIERQLEAEKGSNSQVQEPENID